MIAKNLLLFTLNFLLIFPVNVFGQTVEEIEAQLEEQTANGFPAASGALGVTGGAGNSGNNSRHGNPGQAIVDSAIRGMGMSVSGGAWSGFYGLESGQGFMLHLTSRIFVRRCLNDPSCSDSSFESATPENPFIALANGPVTFDGNVNNLAVQTQADTASMCQVVEEFLNDQFSKDDVSFEENRRRLSNNSLARQFLHGSGSQEHIDSPGNDYNAAFFDNMFQGIGTLCTNQFKADSNPEFCSNKGPGALKSACEEYVNQVANPNEMAEASQIDGHDSIEKTLSTNVRNFVADVSRPNSDDGRESASEPTHNGAMDGYVTNSGAATSCDPNRELCYFTRNPEQPRTGDICNEFDCTMTGSAESTFGADNAQIIDFLSNWAGIDENLNTIGEEEYCNGCMESKHQQLSTNKDFNQSKQEMQLLVGKKLKEMMAKRALLDHASYLENVLDMNAIMNAGKLSRSNSDRDFDMSQAQPDDMFCVSEIQSILDTTSACGVDGLERDNLRHENRLILANVLNSIGISVDSPHGLTGQRVVNGMITASESEYVSSCDGDRSVQRTNGRTRFVMDKMANWNTGDNRRERNELNELLNNLITTKGVHNNNVLTDSMQSICSNNGQGHQAPKVKLAQMTSELVDSYINKINSGEISCDGDSQKNIEYGFTTSSIFYSFLCDGDSEGTSLGHLIGDFEEKNNHYTSMVQNHVPESYVRRAQGNTMINSQLRRSFIKTKVEDLIAKSMDSDPRYGATIGSWGNLCAAYSEANRLNRDNNETTNFEFGDYLKQYKDLDSNAVKEKLTSLRNTNCSSLASKLTAVMCKDSVEIDPENNIQKNAGINFNADDIAKAVREVASSLDDADKLALSSYSCEIRSSMKENQLTDDLDDIAEIGLFGSILDSDMDRPISSISDLELNANANLKEKYLSSGGYEFNDEYMCDQASFCQNVTDLSLTFDWDISCSYNPGEGGALASGGRTNRNGRQDRGQTSSPFSSDAIRTQVNKVASQTSGSVNSPSSNNVGSTTGNVNSGNVSGFVGDVSNGVAGARTNADSGVGTNTGVENGSGPQAGLTQAGGTDLLSSFSNGNGSLGSFNANGNVGNSNTDFSFMEKQISQLQSKQREDMLNAANDESQNSRGPASIDMPSDMDIANMSEDELRALSERLGIDMNELRGNSAKTSKELKNEDENAIGQLLKAMEEQNKSNQDMIAALQEQNSNLTQRLARIESAASASVSNSSNVEVEGDVNASAAFRSNNFAFDLDSNSFRNKATITGEERQSFSPDFASSGQNLSTANFSSYSDSRRSAMRSRDSDINREFLSLIAGESGSYDAVETSRESVERYVDFVNEKGSIVHLVRYDESGRPVSIKVPWSNEEIRLVGEYAALMSKIPPQSEALASEESDYGLYKMVEFSQSLQTFFASEAQEQVQLSSLISELDSAETSVE